MPTRHSSNLGAVLRRGFTTPEFQSQNTGWPTFTACTVPTVETFQAPVEPCVIDTGSVWNGFRYWMAYNNFPTNNNDQVENPSVVCSSDGTTWSTPSGATNPVYPALTGGTLSQYYNSDARLYLLNGTMYVFWRILDVRAGHGTYSEDHWYMSSTDGITWSAAQTTGLRVAYNAGKKGTLLDGCFAFDGNRWIAWTVNTDAIATGQVERWVSSSLGGTWTKTVCTFPALIGSGEKWWHLDIKQTAWGYAGLFQTSFGGDNSGNVYYGYSTDGLTWTTDTSRPVMDRSTGFSCYRASLSRLASNAGWDIWVTRMGDRTLKRCQTTDGMRAQLSGGAAAETVIATVETRAGSAVSNTTGSRDALKEMIQGMIDDGDWATFDYVGVRALPAQTHALMDFVSTHDDSITGALTFTANRGFTGGDSTTNYLQGTYNPTLHGVHYTQNAAGIYFLDRAGIPTGTSEFTIIIPLGASGATVTSMLGQNASNFPAGQLNYASSTGRWAGTNVSTYSATALAITRNPTSTIYVGPTSVGTNGTSSTGVPNAAIVTNCSGRQPMIMIVGGGWSAAAVARINQRVANWKNRLGA